jgi:hypothetical protein
LDAQISGASITDYTLNCGHDATANLIQIAEHCAVRPQIPSQETRNYGLAMQGPRSGPATFPAARVFAARKSTETSYLSGELHKPLWQFVSEWRRGRQFIDLCHKIKSRKKGNGKMNA